MIFSSLLPRPKWIIINRAAEGPQRQPTAPTLKGLWDFMEHRFHEYDFSRADERWQALTPRVVKGQVSPLD